MGNNELTIQQIEADNSFLEDLREGNFVLVIGAGFSFGIRNMVNEKDIKEINDAIKKNGGTLELDFETCKYIPLTEKFKSITERIFFKEKYTGIEFALYANDWKNYGYKFNDFDLRIFFKNLFIANEELFEQEKNDLYKFILVPNWRDIYTLNFDTVIDHLIKINQKNNEYGVVSIPETAIMRHPSVAYLHGSIAINNLEQLIFCDDEYSKQRKIEHTLYDSLFGQLRSGKKLIIIGTQFAENIIHDKLFAELPDDLAIYHFEIENHKFIRKHYIRERTTNYNFIQIESTEQLLRDFFEKNAAKIEKVRELPKNLRLIGIQSNNPESTNVKYFTDYLDSYHLRYLSRDEFRSKLIANEQELFEGEEDILESIYSNEYDAIIIHGQGGIGKTRLMFELGKRALNRDYIVIEVKSSFHNIDELINYITPEFCNKYILLFDYIEEQKIFYQIVQWIADNKKENIKIVANCRNSFRTDIEYSIGNTLVKFINCDEPVQITKKYKREIILSILSSITNKSLLRQLKSREILKSFYEAKPSFAAFIKYIHLRSNTRNFNIVKNEPFKMWLFKKLKYSIVKSLKYDDFFERKKYIFHLLFCMPVDALAAAKLQNTYQGDNCYAHDISRLKKDGWIDDTENGGFKVVHDTVTDSLLFKFLEYFQYNPYYIKEFLEFALKNECVSSAMWSIQRIWDDLPEDCKFPFQKEIASFLEYSINENSVRQDWFIYKIDNTHLLEEGDRIRLLIKYKTLLKETFALEKFGSSLSFSMYWLSDKEENQKAEYSEGLKQLFFSEWNLNNRYDNYVNKSIVGGRIISSYICLFGLDEYIIDIFNTYVGYTKCRIYNLEYISYVVVAWLNKDGELYQGLKELLKSWFEVYEKGILSKINPSYLISAWIKKEINLEIISSPVIICLENLILKKEIKAEIICSWLSKGNDTQLVEPYIEDILNHTISPNSAIFIISSWLNKGGNPNLIKKYVCKWLQDAVSIYWFYVINSWLYEGDEPDLLIEPIKKWMKIEPNPKKVNRVITLFIIRKGTVDEVFHTEIENWLKQNPIKSSIGDLLKKQANKSSLNSLEIQINLLTEDSILAENLGIIIGNWIEKGGSILLVQPYVNKWLKKFWNTEYAVMIIDNWLKRKGNCSDVKEFIIPCLNSIQKNNGKVACKLMYHWMLYGNDPYLIKDNIHLYFEIKENQEFYESKYLITSWLEKAKMPLLIKPAIKPWLSIHGKDNSSVAVCSFWLLKNDEIELVKDYIENSFFDLINNRYSSRVIQTWISKGGNLKTIEKCIEQYLNGNLIDENTARIAELWLKHKGSLDIIHNYVKDKLINYSQDKSCYMIIILWLRFNGDFETIRLSIIKYLEYNWECDFANIIIFKCIVLNKITPEIEIYIFKIIEKSERNPFYDELDIIDNKISIRSREVQLKLKRAKCESIHLTKRIRSELNNNKFQNGIKAEVVSFLEENNTNIYSSYVLSAWIEFGNDFDIIQRNLVEWLKYNLFDEYVSSFVIAIALEYEKGFLIAHGSAIEWLNNFGNTYRSKYLLSSWLKLKGNDGGKEIENWIFFWFENFYEPQKANWRDDLLLNYVESVKIEN